MEMDENFDRITMINLFTFLIESLYLFTQSLVRQIVDTVDKWIKNFRIAELFDAINERLAVHPPLRFLVFATAFSCVIPMGMFIVFGVTSAIIMLAGFLFIEGTLLTVGVLCMFICIAILVLILSAFAVTLGIFYVLVLKLGYALNNLKGSSSKTVKTLSSFIDKEKKVHLSHITADEHQD